MARVAEMGRKQPKLIPPIRFGQRVFGDIPLQGAPDIKGREYGGHFFEH